MELQLQSGNFQFYSPIMEVQSSKLIFAGLIGHGHYGIIIHVLMRYTYNIVHMRITLKPKSPPGVVHIMYIICADEIITYSL